MHDIRGAASVPVMLMPVISGKLVADVAEDFSFGSGLCLRGESDKGSESDSECDDGILHGGVELAMLPSEGRTHLTTHANLRKKSPSRSIPNGPQPF